MLFRSIVTSPILVLVFGLLGVLPFDSLFIGILASLAIMGWGLIQGGKARPA